MRDGRLATASLGGDGGLVLGHCRMYIVCEILQVRTSFRVITVSRSLIEKRARKLFLRARIFTSVTGEHVAIAMDASGLNIASQEVFRRCKTKKIFYIDQLTVTRTRANDRRR